MVYDAKELSSSDLNALRKMQKKHRSAFKEKFPQTTADSIIVNAKKVNKLAKTTLNALKGKTRFMDMLKFFDEFEVSRSLQMQVFASKDEKSCTSQTNGYGNVAIVSLSDSEPDSEPESDSDSEIDIETQIEIDIETQIETQIETESEHDLAQTELESESKSGSGSDSGSIIEEEKEKENEYKHKPKPKHMQEQPENIVAKRIQAIEKEILKKNCDVSSDNNTHSEAVLKTPAADEVEDYSKAEKKEQESLKKYPSDNIEEENIVQGIYDANLRDTPNKFDGVRENSNTIKISSEQQQLIESQAKQIPEPNTIEHNMLPSRLIKSVITYESSDDEENEIDVIKEKDSNRVAKSSSEPEVEIIRMKQRKETRFSNVKQVGEVGNHNRFKFRLHCGAGASDSEEEEVEIIKSNQHNATRTFVHISSDEDDEVEIVQLKGIKPPLSLERIDIVTEDEDEEVVIVQVAKTSGTKRLKKRVTFKDLEECDNEKQLHDSSTKKKDNITKEPRKYGAVRKYFRKSKAKKMLSHAISQNELGFLHDAISFTRNESLDRSLPQLLKKATDAVEAIEESHRKQLELENMYKHNRRKQKIKLRRQK